MFLYFGKLWDVVFWLISFMVFCYKGYNLPYPSNAYEMEFTYLFMYLLIEPPRLFLGSQGNKSVRAGPLWASMLLAGFILFMHVYYIVAQTFVLRVDYWMNIISLPLQRYDIYVSVSTRIASFPRVRANASMW